MLPLHRFAGLPGLAGPLAESLRFNLAAYDSHSERAAPAPSTACTSPGATMCSPTSAGGDDQVLVAR